MPDRLPLRLPIGVRTASTITAVPMAAASLLTRDAACGHVRPALRRSLFILERVLDFVPWEVHPHGRAWFNPTRTRCNGAGTMEQPGGTMGSPQLPPGFDFTDPDLYAHRVPADEFADLRPTA